MKKKFTKKYIIDNKGCYSIEQVERLSFIKKRIIKIEDILNSTISFKDKIWFLWLKCDFNYEQRLDLWNKSIIIQNIIRKYYPDTNGLVFAGSAYLSGSFFGQVAFKSYEKKRIINEILLYIKTID